MKEIDQYLASETNLTVILEVKTNIFNKTVILSGLPKIYEIYVLTSAFTQ